MYFAVPPVLHSAAVDSKFYLGNITELRGALFSPTYSKNIKEF